MEAFDVIIVGGGPAGLFVTVDRKQLGALQELLLIFMNTTWIRNKVRNQFSSSSA